MMITRATIVMMILSRVLDQKGVSGGRNSSLVVFGLAVLRNTASPVRSYSGEIFQ